MSSVRTQIHIDVSSRVVWKALTTTEGVATWWADEVRVDAREGGRIVLSDKADPKVELRGVFLKVRPIRNLEINFDDVGKSPEKGTRVQFLVGRGGGETRVHLVQSGGQLKEDPELSATLEALWLARLTRLRDILES